MTVATRLKHFLEFWKVNYMVFNHSSTPSLLQAAEFISIPVELVITSTLLLLNISVNQSKPVLCVNRLNDEIDTRSIAAFYGLTVQQIKIVKSDLLNQYFDDCLPNVSLPFGEPYGMTSLIDTSIKQLPYVYFSGGGSTSLIRLSREDFIYLTTQARFFTFGKKKKSAATEPKVESKGVKEFEGVNKVKELSGVPNDVIKIVELARSHANVEKFESRLHQHLTFFSLFYPPSSESRHNKFSMVSHVAPQTNRKSLFQIQDTGPLGLKALWQNSLCSAEIAKVLSERVHLHHFSFSSELAFYCGLFHHFGYLPYGFLYAPEFNLLNRLWRANQFNLPIIELEKRILTLGQDKKWITGGHTKIGQALLLSWGLDPIVVATAAHHHNLDYKGVGAEYVKLMYLVDQLLAHLDLGDGILPINEDLVMYFGLSLKKCLEISREIIHFIYSKSDIDSAFARPMSTQ